jgi:glycerate-2-kinase
MTARPTLKRRWFQFLISGGCSALFELRIGAAITLDDLQVINRAMVVGWRGDF